MNVKETPPLGPRPVREEIRYAMLALRWARKEDQPALESRLVELDYLLEKGFDGAWAPISLRETIVPCRWATKDGVYLRVDLMSTAHLKNASKMLEERVRKIQPVNEIARAFVDLYMSKIAQLEAEIAKRPPLPTDGAGPSTPVAE